MRTIIFATFMCLASLSVSAAEARAQLEAFLHDLSSMSAQFAQRVVDENGKLIENSAGEFFVQRPGNFRWSYKQPYAQEIIGTADRVWLYDSDLEQVSIKPIDDALGNSPALLLVSDRPLDDLFEVRDLGKKNAVLWLELKPHNDNGAFASFRIGMADGALRLMELMDNFGQRTQLSFTSIARNPTLKPELFTFTPPPGADVVGDVPAANTQ
jgi:outer membrane lipoprotein carrier protein